MLYKEAVWINKILRGIGPNLSHMSALNLGSSSQDFYSTQQSYIKELVIDELVDKYTQVVNIDIKNSTGVDLVADFLTPDGADKIRKIDADLMLVNNLLEHIVDPIKGIEAISRIMKKDSRIVITGPRMFPYHPDPIDNRFRPKKYQLKKLFSPDFEILELKIIRSSSVYTSTIAPRDFSATNRWLLSKLNLITAFKNKRETLQVIRNLIYPASAFGVYLRRK